MHSNEVLLAVLGMLISFSLPLILVGMILWFKHRKLKMTHDAIARFAEKGLPVPPELLAPPPSNWRAGLRGGLVLLGLGIALAVFLGEVDGPWSIGLIPALMGLGLLIAAIIESRLEGPPTPR